MKTIAWKDLKHKSPPQRLAEIDRKARAELDRIGFAALRKARRQTQVALAEKLGIDQASVSAIENRSDLLLSTLARYVRALGGDVEIRAVFPEATFNLEPLLGGESLARSAALVRNRRVAGKRAPILRGRTATQSA
jgi:transcriptional regulator with XRE-family HTH domain